MTPSEYIEAAKTELELTTDYQLAKRRGISRGSLHSIKAGTRNMPMEIAFKIAITLHLDPATVVADLESQYERNPKKAEFWKSFLSRAAMMGVLACTLASNYSEACGSAANRAGGMTNESPASAVGRLVRIISRYVMSIIAQCERQNRPPAKNRHRHCTALSALPYGFAR